MSIVCYYCSSDYSTEISRQPKKPLTQIVSERGKVGPDQFSLGRSLVTNYCFLIIIDREMSLN